MKLNYPGAIITIKTVKLDTIDLIIIYFIYTYKNILSNIVNIRFRNIQNGVMKYTAKVIGIYIAKRIEISL